MNRANIQRITRRHNYLLALLLLIIALGINWYLQDNLFEQRVLGNNLRTWLSLIVITVGQTIVIIGGGIDLSVGAIVSMSNAILVTLILPDSPPEQVFLGIIMATGAGVLAGAFNGWCTAYLRLQPIITTYATSFVYAGIALLILPRPGGSFPMDMLRTYRRMAPFGIPLTVFIIIGVIVFWIILRTTRYGQFLYATGGKFESAYATGIAVNRVRFSTYLWSGFFSAMAALALTMNVGTGNPRIGDAMTLDSVVAVVLGGTRLSGGQGGVVGSIIGVIILGTIRNIISFANVPTWSQTLVDALIIIAALAGPGVVRFARRRVA
ncbi:ABC transporter permease [Chloroflexota bacterium]